MAILHYICIVNIIINHLKTSIMCKNAILPTVMEADRLGSDTANLIYVFNRWLSILDRYGKLEYYESDFMAISKIVKKSTDKSIRRAVACCRDYALAETLNAKDLMRSLRKALRLMIDAHDTSAIKAIKKTRDDQGMTERYSHLSKRLSKERIRKIGKSVIFTDECTDDAYTTRLVRRIVEKRAAQAAYRIAKGHDLESNSYRQAVRRAVSFSLYKKTYVDYDVTLRINGTHWKVWHITGVGPRLTAKKSYNSYEEAEAACERHRENHPGDPRPMSPYRCDYCCKWHIGHERIPEETQVLDNTAVCEVC